MIDIKGMTFAPFAGRGVLEKEETRRSLTLMRERTKADTVIFVPGGLQKTAHSTEIDYRSETAMGDSELTDLICYARDEGLRVFLKPTVNCLDGTWRAYIRFFDEDVPCEPKWSEWFAAYTDFQLHYARIAQETGCEMFLAGCEMVMTEHREEEWRRLIAEIRSEYSGLVSYNTDKYQEHNVAWWDCVDVIASSGYYPAYDWERQLDRIERVVNKFGNPFFFAETGCMSTAGASLRPNDWELEGETDLEEQKKWYETALAAIKKRSWVKGAAFWSWSPHLYPEEEAKRHRYYELYAKPAEAVVRRYFEEREGVRRAWEE